MNQKNLFSEIPEIISEELFEKIVSTNNLKIERIISDGHASPQHFWYDQEKNELVFLLKGNALIEFSNGEMFSMHPGDYIKIEAHQKHRVVETSKSEKTIWLAIHY